MSHNPGPGVNIPANAWSKSITIPASMLNGSISSQALQQMTAMNMSANIAVGSNPILGREQLLEEWPMTETDLLKEEVKKLASKVLDLEATVGRQVDQINDLYNLIEALQQNNQSHQNNAGQHGYQVAGLVASAYHGEKTW